jgi:hypothetical protein
MYVCQTARVAVRSAVLHLYANTSEHSVCLCVLLPVRCVPQVHFIIAACENMVHGKGLRPGDVLKSAHGKTVEVNK